MSNKTENVDINRIKSLITKFLKSTETIRIGSSWLEEPQLLTDWFASLEGSYTIASYRQYRKLLAGHLEDLSRDIESRSPNDPQAKDLLKEAGRIRQLGKTKRQPSGDLVTGKDYRDEFESEYDSEGNAIEGGSGRSGVDSKKTKASDIDFGHIEKLYLTLTSTRYTGVVPYQHGYSIAQWLQVGMMTGLRPSEWEQAELLEEFEVYGERHKYVLRVRGAMKGAKRDESEYTRHLDLSGLKASEIEMVRSHLVSIKTRLAEVGGDFGRLMNIVRCTLVKANIRAFGVRGKITLYTSRHIFADESRRSGNVSRYGLAALLGHTTTMNRVYYTVRENGEKRRFTQGLARPLDAEVLAVYTTHQIRFKKRMGLNVDGGEVYEFGEFLKRWD